MTKQKTHKAAKKTSDEIVVSRARQVTRAITDLEVSLGMAFRLFRKRVENIFEPGSSRDAFDPPTNLDPYPPAAPAPPDPLGTDMDPRFFESVIAEPPSPRGRKRRATIADANGKQHEYVVTVSPPSEAYPNEPLGAYARLILGVLVRFGRPCSTSFVAIVLGRSESGSFIAAVAELRRHGYVSGDRSALRVARQLDPSLRLDVAPLPTGTALVDMWIQKLDPCAAAILQTLHAYHPQAMGSEEVAQRSRKPNGEPYSVSGSFIAAIAKLRKLELIDGRGSALRLHDVFVEAVRP